ncbi:hypothetical protein FJY68_05860 [candidate division WOR-3 bacterium]|uniref:Uncharacterized protein n=1 Tax=candidate division WOR-3 bacterium TaxID=2052148 RepID=A0A938BT37_UNCW3|nr:hypothetical protein [candidate division WOR-3 bacterium]
MKQALEEVEAKVEGEARYEPDSDFSPPPDDDCPGRSFTTKTPGHQGPVEVCSYLGSDDD